MSNMGLFCPSSQLNTAQSAFVLHLVDVHCHPPNTASDDLHSTTMKFLLPNGVETAQMLMSKMAMGTGRS